jgi:hypothetical protein
VQRFSDQVNPFQLGVGKKADSAPVGLELPILALNPGLSNVARRWTSVLR